MGDLFLQKYEIRGYIIAFLLVIFFIVVMESVRTESENQRLNEAIDNQNMLIEILERTCE